MPKAPVRGLRIRRKLRAPQIEMPDQSPPDRYKADMPEIPGVSAEGSRRAPLNNPAVRMTGALLAVLLVVFFGARWMLRPGVEPRQPNRLNEVHRLLLIPMQPCPMLRSGTPASPALRR